MALKRLPDIVPDRINPPAPAPSKVTVVSTKTETVEPTRVEKAQATDKVGLASKVSDIFPVKVNNTPTVIKTEPKPTTTEIADSKIIKVVPAEPETITNKVKVVVEKFIDDWPINITITEPPLPIIEKTLSPVDANIDKTVVTEMTIDPKYFMPTNIIDRKTDAEVFNFDYLSYLFFEININENIPSFYTALDIIIRDSLFEREEDPGTVTPENTIDPATMKLIFNQIWTMAKDAAELSEEARSIKNLIGFYIYFNRKLGFLPILVQGTTLNEFLSDMTLESILDKLSTLGLYPISGYNLFERLWNSYTYSVLENANRAEIKLSLREFIDYDINRNIAEVYSGFTNKNDQLIITYKLDPSKWADKKTFRSDSAAFKRFKQITTAYITAQGATTFKKYLLDLLPVQDYTGIDMTLNSSVFARKSILSVSTDASSPNKQLWMTLQSFDDVFKINKTEINKSNIRKLFIEFSSSQGFPVDSIAANQYLDLWLSWVSYLNSKASSITTTLDTSTDTDHNYKEMYNQLVWLTNAKFIIQYLQNNNSFDSSDYTDGADYINAALLKVYQSLAVLKTQIQNTIKYIKQEDSRFIPTSIK